MTPYPPIEEQIRRRRAEIIREEIDRRLKGVVSSLTIEELKRQLDELTRPKPANEK